MEAITDYSGGYNKLYKAISRINFMEKCVSCDKSSQNCVKFKCPKCKEEILRCNRCRALSIEFKCPCGFVGP